MDTERDKHKELEMLNQANFIDKAIEAFCALELQKFKYEKPKFKLILILEKFYWMVMTSKTLNWKN